MSKQLLWKLILAVAIAGLLAACAPAAAPTAAPTKPAASTAPISAPTVAVSGAATAPAGSGAATAKPAAAATTPTPAAKVKRGGTLISARYQTYSDMDAHRTVTSGPITYNIYDPLLNYNLVDEKSGKFELGPGLAEEWKVIEPKLIELKLRKGVKFHDGSDWNAEVAKWNLLRLRDDAKSTGKITVSEIDQIDVVDPQTIRLRLKSPWAPFFAYMTASTGGPAGSAPHMVSKAAVDAGGDAILSTKPVGTGPFVIDQWLRDDRIILKKFNGYWGQGADGQPLPYLDGFVERYIADTSVQLVELKAGGIQLAETLEAKDIAGVKANPELVYFEMPWVAQAYFTFGFNQEATPFKGKPAVAKAAQYALDRENMAKTMGFGLASPAYYVNFQPGIVGYSEDIPKYKFDLNKAKQLLTEAGYPNGVDISLIVTLRQPDQRIGELVKAMWDAGGLRTTLDVQERLNAIAKAKNKDFQGYFWREPANPDPDVATRMVTCGAASNWSSYCNPELDKCMAEGRSIYDEKERDKIYRRCLTIIQEDALVGSGYFLPSNKVFHKSVKGLQFHWYNTDIRTAWIDK